MSPKHLGSAALMALAFALAHAASAADQLDAQTQDSLKRTQQLLRDRGQRDKALKENASAQQNQAELDKLTGGDAAMSDAAYGLSADIMARMVQDSGGDPAKLQEMILEAQKDPEKFMKKLTPSERAKIQQMGKQIEAKQPAGKP